MPEVVELQMNAAQVFDVIGQLQARMGNLEGTISNTGGRGGDRIGEGFLRSERIVSRSAANMATSLLTINDPLNAVANGLLQFEHATKLGLGLAVGLAVGIAAFEVLHKQIEETKKVEEDFRKVTERPLSLQLGLSAADLGKEIADQEKQNETLQARTNSTGNLAGIIASRTTKDPQSFVQDRLAAQDAEAAAGSNKLIDLIKAQAGAEANLVNIKAQGVRGSEEDAAITKAELDYTEKVAALRKAAVDNPNLYAGLQVRLDAAKQERDITEDLIRKKSSMSQVDLIGAQQQADFRGTPEERKDFALQNQLESAQAKKAIVDALGNEQDKAQAVLDISKAQLAIDERQVEKAKQQVDIKFSREETELKVQAVRDSIDLTPEKAKTAEIETQVKLAQLKLDRAREELALDKDSVAAQKALTAAAGEREIAELKGEAAVRAQFGPKPLIKDADQAEKAAEKEIEQKQQEEMDNLFKQRVEQEIAARTQKFNEAGQDITSAHPGFLSDQERKAADEIQRLRQTGAAKSDVPGGGQEDQFSALAEAAGSAGENLKTIAEMDFSGLEALAGLSISIA